MATFDKIAEIMQQEVNRKEFLRGVGIALLGLVGITGMMHNLKLTNTQQQQRSPGSGYGISSYGR